MLIQKGKVIKKKINGRKEGSFRIGERLKKQENRKLKGCRRKKVRKGGENGIEKHETMWTVKA